MASFFSHSSKKKGKISRGIDLDRALSGVSEAAPILRNELPLRGDRRQSKRADYWAVCSVVYPSGDRREGVLLNTSEGGARVRFRSRGSLPNRVLLSSSRLDIKRVATVIWEDTYDAGLEYIDVPSQRR